MAVLESVVGDASSAKRLLSYNRLSFSIIRPENSIMIFNFINKRREIVLTNDSKCILIPKIEVPPAIMTEANTLKNEMTNLDSPKKTITEILSLPTSSESSSGRQTFTLIGKIIKVDEPMTVTTRFNTEVLVRNGEIGDSTGMIDFAMWRDKASFHMQPGDCVDFQICTLSSTSSGLPKVTCGNQTQVKLLPPNTLTNVQTTSLHQEVGSIEGITKITMYTACPDCQNKKLDNNKCMKCGKLFSNDNKIQKAVMSVMVSKDNGTEDLTLFDNQIKKLFTAPIDFTTEQQLQDAVLKEIPLKITYTPSPKKDNTVTSFERLN